MPCEISQRRKLHWRQLMTKARETGQCQGFTHFNIDRLRRGDPKARNEFHFIQQWHTRALHISVAQLREYMRQVDISELEGFGVVPIDRAIESTEAPSNGYASYTQPMVQPPASPAPSTTYYGGGASYVIGDGGDQLSSLPEAVSFNMPPLGLIEFPTSTELAPSDALSTNLSWLDPIEVPTSTEAAPLTEAASINTWLNLTEEPAGPGPQDLSGWPIPTDPVWFSNPGPALYYNGESSGPEDKPLSNELRNLLRRYGASTNVTRTKKEVALTPAEYFRIEQCWDHEVMKMRSQEPRRKRSYDEMLQEHIIFDAWDKESGQFYWQKEGLFLCRLTELLRKEQFESARVFFWTPPKIR